MVYDAVSNDCYFANYGIHANEIDQICPDFQKPNEIAASVEVVRKTEQFSYDFINQPTTASKSLNRCISTSAGGEPSL